MAISVDFLETAFLDVPVTAHFHRPHRPKQPRSPKKNNPYRRPTKPITLREAEVDFVQIFDTPKWRSRIRLSMQNAVLRLLGKKETEEIKRLEYEEMRSTLPGLHNTSNVMNTALDLQLAFFQTRQKFRKKNEFASSVDGNLGYGQKIHMPAIIPRTFVKFSKTMEMHEFMRSLCIYICHFLSVENGTRKEDDSFVRRVGQLYSWILLKQRKPQAEKCFFECLIAMANLVVKDILASLITYSDIKMDLVDKELAHIFRGFFYPFEAPAFIPKPLNDKDDETLQTLKSSIRTFHFGLASIKANSIRSTETARCRLLTRREEMENLAHKHMRKAKLLVELIIRRNEAASLFKKRGRSAEGMNGKLMSICFKSLSPSIALYLKQVTQKNVSEQLIPESFGRVPAPSYIYFHY